MGNLSWEEFLRMSKGKKTLFETQVLVEWLEKTCDACKGPFHIATGHVTPGNKQYNICGPCYREMLPHLKRRWGGERFYDHAGPLPVEAPIGWRPEDVLNE